MKHPDRPLDDQSEFLSPFDRPVKRGKIPFWKRPRFRKGYWIVCLTLIGLLLLYIRLMLQHVEHLMK